MNSPRTILCLLGVILLQACVVRSGADVEGFAVARSPRGIEVSLTARDASEPDAPDARLTGELIEVRDDGLLVRAVDATAGSSPALYRITWPSIREARFEEYPVRWRAGTTPDADALGRLRRVARFPPGLNEDQLRRLLEDHGQDEARRIGARSEGANEEDFVRAARAAAAKLRSPEEASLAGYRPVGPDFPGMGAHWVNPFLLMRGGTEAGSPPVLTYLATPQGTRLTGLAYARIVQPGEDPPDAPFPGAWHGHGGTLDEELLALNPESALNPRSDEPRLAMVHVWTDLENPAGVLEQDNWAVPFVRLGLSPPNHPTPRQGKALFLASGGDSYYLDLIVTAGDPSAAERGVVEEILVDHRKQVERLIGGGSASSPSALEALEGVWVSLWTEIEAAVAPATWTRIRTLSL